MIGKETPLARPESIEDETSYTDCNLKEVINFCETYKLEGEIKPKRIRKKPEKNETCFLNKPPQVADSPISAERVNPMRISRSCSVGFLDDVYTGMVRCQLSLILLNRNAPKRLFLVRKKPTRKLKSSHSFNSSEFLALRKSDDERNERVSLSVYLVLALTASIAKYCVSLEER